MGDAFSEFMKTLERLPVTAFRISTPLFVVGGALWAGLHFGIIRKEALNGYLADGAPIVTIVGAAIFVVGLLWLIIDRVPDGFRRKAETRIRLGKLLENMRFLPHESLIILLDLLNQPSGRGPSPGNTKYFGPIAQLKLVQSESDYVGATSRGQMVSADPVLVKDRDEVKQYIRVLLGQNAHAPHLNDPRKVSELASAFMTEPVPRNDGW